MACQPTTQRFTFSGEAFGTTYNIVVLAEDTPQITSALDSLIHVVNRSLSTYDPSSDISKINDGQSGVVVDTMFAEVFQLSNLEVRVPCLVPRNDNDDDKFCLYR